MGTTTSLYKTSILGRFYQTQMVFGQQPYGKSFYKTTKTHMLKIVKCRFPVHETPYLLKNPKTNKYNTPIVYDLTVDDSDDECLCK